MATKNQVAVRHSLHAVEFAHDSKRMNRIKEDDSLDDVLKWNEVYRFTENDQAALNLVKDTMKRVLDEKVRDEPTSVPEDVMKAVVERVAYKQENIDLLELFTNNRAVNIEIAIATDGESFNRKQLISNNNPKNAREIHFDSLEKVMMKLRNDLLPARVSKDTSPELIKYEDGIPAAEGISPIFMNMLKKYFDANYRVKGKKIIPFSYKKDGEEDPTSLKQKILTWTAIGGATLAALVAAYYIGKGHDTKPEAAKKMIVAQDKDYSSRITDEGVELTPYEQTASIQFGYDSAVISAAQEKTFNKRVDSMLKGAKSYFENKYGKDISDISNEISLVFEWVSAASPDGSEDYNNRLSDSRNRATLTFVRQLSEKYGFDPVNVNIKSRSIGEYISPVKKNMLEQRAKKLGYIFEDYISTFSEGGQKRLGTLDGMENEYRVCQDALSGLRKSFMNTIGAYYNDPEKTDQR